jgi:hypothetical protein
MTFDHQLVVGQGPAGAYRASTKQPSPPSDEYLLRKLLHCDRCGARMHGHRGSKPERKRAYKRSQTIYFTIVKLSD